MWSSGLDGRQTVADQNGGPYRVKAGCPHTAVCQAGSLQDVDGTERLRCHATTLAIVVPKPAR